MPYWTPRRRTLQDDIDKERDRVNFTQARVAAPRVDFTQPEVQQPERTIIGEKPQRDAFIQPIRQWQTEPMTPSASVIVQQPQVPRIEKPSPEPVQSVPQERKWWGTPEEKIGQAISHVPLLPQALGFVAPVFEFIHEKLEKPFAAIITSPFRPDLPWKQGESWLDHQKREYDAWQAPDYIKGAAEFAMPLWWMPWFSWAKAGGKALGIGSKAASRIAKAGKLQTVAEHGLPTDEILNKVLFKDTRTGGILRATENIPILGRIVKAVGGLAAFAHPTATDPLNVTRRALIKMGYISDMRNGVTSLLVPKLQAMGKLETILGMDAKGVVRNIVDKSGKSEYLYDVLEGAIANPKGYKFLAAEAKQYVETVGSILDDVYSLARNEGVKIPKATMLHRLVKGKTSPKTGVYEKSEFGSLFEIERSHEFMKGGVEAGVDYGLSINESVTSTINHYVKAIAQKRFVKEVGKLGKTPKQLWRSSMEGQELAELNALGKAGILKHAARINELQLSRSKFLKHHRGRQILGENLAKFRAHPVFKESIFPKEVVKTAEKVLEDQGQQWLSNMAQISGTSRMLVAAMDLSAPFIQGLAMLGRNPLAWASGVKNMLNFAVKPQNLYKYMVNPEIMATRMERILAGGSSSTFEYFEALAGLQRVAGKVPLVGKQFDKFIGATYGRAETAFTGFGEVARNNMWKALKREGMTPDELGDLARTIDRMTGVMSTEALAIGRTQQDFENAFVFFAPRYTRAGLAFAGDMLKGGMTGAEARKAIGSMMGGGLAMYYGAARVLGQEPNLNPNSGRFLTLKIGDTHVGIGGIMIALMRFGYDVGVTAAEDPINLIKPLSEGTLNRWDNPFIRFLYARTAPLTSTLYSTLVEQADYFGEPFEDIGDWGEFMLNKITPIAVQGIMEDPDPAVAGAEIAGMRAFPKSPWVLLDEQRDEISLRDYGKPYDDLDDLDKMRLDRDENVIKLQREVDSQTVTRGDADSVSFLKWERERDSARTVYEETINNLQRAYDSGSITGYDFRERLQDAGYGLGVTYDHIMGQPEYEGIREILDKPRKVGDKSLNDIGYAEFMDVIFSGVLDDEFGIFQYDKYNAFIEDFRGKYGDEVYGYVLEMKTERDQELPPLFHEYQNAKVALRPYWGIKTDVERMFGAFFAESKAGERLISKLRRTLKLQNPEIAQYLELFYTR